MLRRNDVAENVNGGNSKNGSVDWRFIITFVATVVPTVVYVAVQSGQQISKIEQIQQEIKNSGERVTLRTNQIVEDLRGQITQNRVIDEKQLDQMIRRFERDEQQQAQMMQTTVQNQAYIEGLVRTIQQMQQTQNAGILPSSRR